MTRSRCRLCGGSDLRLLYTQGCRDEFRFFRCRSCRLVNYDLSTGLDQAKYSRELPDPRLGDGAANSSQTMTYRFIRRRMKAPGSLLDIGCGNGRLLYLAGLDGWRVEGVEISPEHASRTAALLGVPVYAGVFPDDLPELSRKYDLVVLRHVLEHIPDPMAAMSAVRALLSGGGRALLEFPDIDGLDPRWKRMLRRLHLYRRRYAPHYLPGHCNEFCRMSFQALLDRSGMAMDHWETYSFKPLQNAFFHLVPVGGKARALISASDVRHPEQPATGGSGARSRQE